MDTSIKEIKFKPKVRMVRGDSSCHNCDASGKVGACAGITKVLSCYSQPMGFVHFKHVGDVPSTR